MVSKYIQKTHPRILERFQKAASYMYKLFVRTFFFSPAFLQIHSQGKVVHEDIIKMRDEKKVPERFPELERR
jgi:hypothetical protein